jgi:TPR repeat protein
MSVSMRFGGLRQGVPAACLVLWLSAGPAALAKSVAKPGAQSEAARPSSTESEVQRLVLRYDAVQLVVLKEQLCLQTTGCFTDEGRLLDALETAKRVGQALADRAQAGDADAAYQRGLIALKAARAHANRSRVESDAQFQGSTAVLQRRWAQETATAEKYLSMAAMTQHSPACLALAVHLAERVPQPEALLVARLYRCAVIGFSALGDRAAAIDAFVKMRQACHPMDPMLIEAHTVIYRSIPPDRPWRQVEPDEALALRKQSAP